MNQTSRTAVLAVAVAALVALTGCASAGSPAAAGGGGTVSASPATQWAGSVCSSVQNLEQSLKNLAGKLTINGTGSQSGLNQVKQQLLKRLGEVDAAAGNVASTLQNPPAAADPQVKAAQQQLKAAASLSEQALQQVKSAATQLQAASTPAQFAKDAVTVGAVSAAAANDVGALLSSLEQDATSTHSSVKKAFGSAPSCQSLSNNE